MNTASECFDKVKTDCFKFIKSQETSKEKFKGKEKMLKSFLIPACFWISSKAKSKHPFILGLVGGQGTGKTTTSSILEIILKKQGSFIFKIWKGEEEKEIIKMLKKIFDKVEYFKPKSSRQESSEIFIISRGFRLHEE